MSIVPKENVEIIAQSIGINNLSPDVALALVPDIEYRLREIMQEAIKCMHHSRRTRLTAEDVDGALNLRNVEPIYGYVSGGPLRFKRAIGHRDLFYIDDKDVDFKDVIEAPLPKAPLDTGIVCHWLAIEGVQPAIPENAPLEVLAPPSDGKIYNQKDDGLPVDIKLPVKHILSRELQLYFDKITELVVSRSDLVLFKEALVSLATDSGLHPLVPYFTCFIADEVSRGLNDYALLFALMRVVRSLLQNPHIHIEPYVDELDKAISVAARDPTWYGIDEVELEKRRRWTSTARAQVGSLKKAVEAGKDSSGTSVNGMRRELMRVANSQETERSNPYGAHHNDDFITSESDRQLLLIKQQDEELDELSASVERIGGVGLTIHEELLAQEKIVEELGTEMDGTSNRLDFVQKKVAAVMKKAGVKGQFMMILFLLVLFIILFVLVFLT